MIAADIRLQPKVTVLSLDQANEALHAVKNDAIDGAGDLSPETLKIEPISQLFTS